MAIDKVQDLSKETIVIDPTVEVQTPAEELADMQMDIQMTEDGGAEVDLDPSAAAPEGSQNH